MNEGCCIVNIPEKLAQQHAPNTTFGLFDAASLFRLRVDRLVSHLMLLTHFVRFFDFAVPPTSLTKKGLPFSVATI